MAELKTAEELKDSPSIDKSSEKLNAVFHSVSEKMHKDKGASTQGGGEVDGADEILSDDEVTLFSVFLFQDGVK